MVEKVFGFCVKCDYFIGKIVLVCVIYVIFFYIGVSLGIISDGFFELEELFR